MKNNKTNKINKIKSKRKFTLKKSLKKGGNLQNINEFLNLIANNEYPEGEEQVDNILFGYKREDLKHIKSLDLITLDDLELIAQETTIHIDAEYKKILDKINRLQRFKSHILNLINNFNDDIYSTEFPNYNRRSNFHTPPESIREQRRNAPYLRRRSDLNTPSESIREQRRNAPYLRRRRPSFAFPLNDET